MEIPKPVEYIFASIFFIVSIMIIRSVLINLYLGRRTKKWPRVSGEVKSSKYELKKSESYDDITYSHFARVKYKYTINSIDYQSNQIFIGDENSSSDYLSKQRVEKYTPGSIVTVYCDPEHPEKSVLEPGIHLEIFPWLGFGILILGIIVAYILQEIGR